MNFDFHPEARVEFRQAATFYETRQPGLGAKFTVEVEAAILRILENPSRFRILEQDVHTHRTNIFPYAVLYSVEPGFILIVAVMHLRRKPGYWHRRVE
jgi:toxin ParE1/3/4